MKSQDDFLTQVCPTEIPYWDKNYGTIFMMAVHLITYSTSILAVQSLV